MTPFTDDDLKRLKAKEGYWKTTVKMNEGQSESWGFVDGDKIDSLLARLEAAEAWGMAEREHSLDLQSNKLRTQRLADEAEEAWRKAKGDGNLPPPSKKAAGK